jgi:quercetin dioxygenase-like cupin family protein
MHTVNLASMELMEGWCAGDPSVHFQVNLALFGGNGAEDSSTVYIELHPGEALGEHTDSPEEVLLVLDREGESQVGEEQARAEKGTLGVVPAMVPHAIR